MLGPDSPKGSVRNYYLDRVLGIIDTKPYLDYILFCRRLRFAFGFSSTAYHFEVFIIDDSPHFQ